MSPSTIAFSIGFRSIVNTSNITAIEGTINPLLPNISKQTNAAASPMIDDRCDFSFSQLSTKITSSSAVITKSSPGSSICMNDPASAPAAAPLTQ